MADFNIQIDPKQIEQAVTDAIIKSGIGKRIDEAVKKSLETGWGRDKSPFQAAIDSQVGDTVRHLLREVYAEKIKASVQEKLEAFPFDQMVAKVIEKLTAQVEW